MTGEKMIFNKDVLCTVYGEADQSLKRFERLSRQYKKNFNSMKMEFFSAPGRTEIVGNHTDHNGGKILAASINMDTIAAAYPNNSEIIEIVSEGYKDKIILDIGKLESVPTNHGTISLLAGMVKAVTKFGFNISGFNAYISTEVISSAGVSSSASFEMLICSIIDFFFNKNMLNPVIYAKIGQYAENYYWDKASGLMDQMACAVGGTILLDFSKDVEYQKVDFDFSKIGYQLVIVNTGKGHADLSKEYSEVPNEMFMVANSLGVSHLCETNLNKLLIEYNKIKKNINNDRAVLRGIHFFNENERVENMVKAISEHDEHQIIKIIEESGKSSCEILQNCYSISNYREQKINLYLALTEIFLKKIGKGACRVHGGGFAGVIMTVLPIQYLDEYICYMSNYVGRENIYPLNVRQAGAIHLELIR